MQDTTLFSPVMDPLRRSYNYHYYNIYSSEVLSSDHFIYILLSNPMYVP